MSSGKKKFLIIIGALCGRRGNRGSALRNISRGHDDLWRPGAQLSQVPVFAGGHGDHRNNPAYESAGSRGAFPASRRRGIAERCGGRLAKLQQDTDLAAVLAARPDQYEECREPEGPVHLRSRNIHGLRIRPDHGEQRSDRYGRVRDFFPINAATCAENWRTHLDYPGALLPANRGAAYMDGMLFRGTQDCRVLAFDFKTGKQVWETTICDPKRGESVPSAPIAWDGLVYVGNAGGDYKGGRGKVYALEGRPAKLSGNSFSSPKSRATWSEDRWANRRSTHRPGKTRRAFPSAAAGRGPRTRSISRTACCTSREATRPPDFRLGSPRGRESIHRLGRRARSQDGRLQEQFQGREKGLA